MSISNAIAPHLPYLRRYARALTGSQESGDTFVVALLEALIAEPSIFPGDLEPKTALYQTFTRLRNATPSSSGGESAARGPADEARPGRALQAITPLPRQAFLLVSLEQFSLAEAARILDMTEEEVSCLLDEAAQEIAAQIETDVMIIEDEPIIAMDLEALVEDLGHRVTGTARTHTEALALARERRPGLVLADILLADGSSGLDAVREILASFEVPVVFITAYPERLLTGERPEPAFLITKPFQTETVKAIISQALFFDHKARLKGGGGAGAA